MVFYIYDIYIFQIDVRFNYKPSAMTNDISINQQVFLILGTPAIETYRGDVTIPVGVWTKRNKNNCPATNQ